MSINLNIDDYDSSEYIEAMEDIIMRMKELINRPVEATYHETKAINLMLNRGRVQSRSNSSPVTPKKRRSSNKIKKRRGRKTRRK